MGAVAITRTDLSAAELRASAAQMKDAQPGAPRIGDRGGA